MINRRNNRRMKNNRKNKERSVNYVNNAQNVQTDRVEYKLQENVTRMKYLRGWVGIYAISATPQFIPLANALTYGLGPTERIGDRVRIHKIDYRLSITAADLTNVVRIMWIYVRGNPTSFATSDFLEAGPSTFIDVYSQIIPYVKGQTIEVLYDRTFSVCQNSDTSIVHEEGSVHVGRNFMYDINNPLASLSGDIYWFCASDSGVVTHPQVVMNPKVWFTDL